MRFLFSVLSILFVVAIVGLLAKKQLASMSDAQRSAPASSRVLPRKARRRPARPRNRFSRSKRPCRT